MTFTKVNIKLKAKHNKQGIILKFFSFHLYSCNQHLSSLNLFHMQLTLCNPIVEESSQNILH